MKSLVRRAASAAMAAVLLLGGVTASLAQSSFDAFADTAGSYAEQEIKALAKAGVLTGYGDGTFQPYGTTTRAEAAKAIVLAMGLRPDPNGAQSFHDVASGAWYRGYVGALAQSGIANGVAPNRFAPDAPITREQVVVLYIRALGMENAAYEIRPDAEISDFAKVANWAKPYIAVAAQLGFVSRILTENEASAFQPQILADRQALAQLTYEYFVNREVYESLLAQWLGGEPTESAPSVAAVSVINNTTVKVTFEEVIGPVGVRDFRFEPVLEVLKAAQPEGDDKSIVLTTEAQLPGSVYKLMYKGKPTGFTVVGVGNGGSASGGNGQDGDAPGGQDSIANQLAGGGTLGDVTITASGIYGPTDESGLTTTVAGTLTIDPGPDGEVELRNINPDRLDVLSGKDESIKLTQTIIKQLRVNAVNNGGKDVRIEVRNGAEVDSVSVESQAILETTSPTSKLGTITLAAAAASKTITLRGNIDGDVVVNAPGSSIKLEPPSGGSGVSTTELRKNLILNAAVRLAAPENTRISQVSIGGTNTAVTLEGGGHIGQITVDASANGASLQLGEGANIDKIQANANVVLLGDPNAIVGVRIEGDGGISVDDSVKNDVREAAVSNAREAIGSLPDTIVYSEELQAAIDRSAELVEVAKGYGAADADISNLSKLKSVQDSVQQLKDDVEWDAADLHVNPIVTGTIVLPARGTGGTDILWASSNDAVIHPSGTVTRPAEGEEDAAVKLTATVSKQGYSIERTFDVTVPAEETVEIPTVTGLVYDAAVRLEASTLQLQITARYSDDTIEDITALATGWHSTSPSVATVSSTGGITAVSSGTTIVTAEYGGFTATFEVTVVLQSAEVKYSLSPIFYTSPSSTDRWAHGSGIVLQSNLGAAVPSFVIEPEESNPYLYVRLNGSIDADAYLGAEITGLGDAEVVGYDGQYLIIHCGVLTQGSYNVTLSGLKVTQSSIVKTVAPIDFIIVKS